MNGTLMTVVFVLLVLAAIPCNIFPILYATTSKWWTNYMGRSLMGTKTSLAIALDLTIAFYLHKFPLIAQFWMAIVVYAMIAAALWFQLISYLLLLRKTRRDVTPPT